MTEPEQGEKLWAFLLGPHGTRCLGSEVGSVEFVGLLQYKLCPRVTCTDLFERTILNCCSESSLE